MSVLQDMQLKGQCMHTRLASLNSSINRRNLVSSMPAFCNSGAYALSQPRDLSSGRRCGIITGSLSGPDVC